MLTLAFAHIRKHLLVLTLSGYCVMVTVLMIGLSAAARSGFRASQNVSDYSVLNTGNAKSLAVPTPIAYLTKIKAVPGVQEVTYVTAFDASTGSESRVFPVAAVRATKFFQFNTNLQLPSAARGNWFADLRGAIAGAVLAREHGWRVGQQIPLNVDFRLRNGGKVLYVNLDGIYKVQTPSSPMLRRVVIHYKYLNGNRLNDRDTVNAFFERVHSPGVAKRVAALVDEALAGETPMTRTVVQSAYLRALVGSYGNLPALFRLVDLIVVSGMLLALVGGLLDVTRQDMRSYALLRALGFRRITVWRCVLIQLGLPIVLGGAFAIGLTLGIAPEVRSLLPSTIGTVSVSYVTLALQVGLVVFTALAASFVGYEMATSGGIAAELSRSR